MIEGEEDTKEIVKLHRGKMQSYLEDLAASLIVNANRSATISLCFKTVKTSIESKQVIMSKIDEQIVTST